MQRRMHASRVSKIAVPMGNEVGSWFPRWKIRVEVGELFHSLLMK